jgi:LysM repeat protein
MQTTYKVRSGDNLWTIAKKKGVSVAAIRKANAPKKLNVLQIGQVIKLPVK